MELRPCRPRRALLDRNLDASVKSSPSVTTSETCEGGGKLRAHRPSDVAHGSPVSYKNLTNMMSRCASWAHSSPAATCRPRRALLDRNLDASLKSSPRVTTPDICTPAHGGKFTAHQPSGVAHSYPVSYKCLTNMMSRCTSYAHSSSGYSTYI